MEASNHCDTSLFIAALRLVGLRMMETKWSPKVAFFCTQKSSSEDEEEEEEKEKKQKRGVRSASGAGSDFAIEVTPDHVTMANTKQTYEYGKTVLSGKRQH